MTTFSFQCTWVHSHLNDEIYRHHLRYFLRCNKHRCLLEGKSVAYIIDETEQGLQECFKMYFSFHRPTDWVLYIVRICWTAVPRGLVIQVNTQNVMQAQIRHYSVVHSKSSGPLGNSGLRMDPVAPRTTETRITPRGIYPQWHYAISIDVLSFSQRNFQWGDKYVKLGEIRFLALWRSTWLMLSW